jgi:hypothetical protein
MYPAGMNSILARISKDGIDKLALRFPAGALKGAGAALAAAMNEEGFLVAPGALAPGDAARWRFENLEQDGEGALLLGPYFEGSSLDEAEGGREGMPLLLSVARALEALASGGALPRGIVSSGILLSGSRDDPGARALLLLPPSAVSRALSASGERARSGAVARLSSPRSKGPEADASFLLAQAAYRYIAGSPAFEREGAEAGSLAPATRLSASALLVAPRLDRALAAVIDRALDDPNKVSLRSWVEALEAAAAAGWERELAPGEEDELLRLRASSQAESAARLRRADFFRKRGGALVVAAVVLAVGALFAGDMIRAQRDKPNFAALPPLQLVRQYYAALDSLDLDALQACGAKDAISRDYNMVMTMTVITKTRTAYEGKDPVFRAKDWVAAGKPKLAPTDLLYGVDAFELADEGGSAGSERLRASYSFWSLERKDDPSGDPGKAVSLPLEERRVDELTLAEGKKGWQIVGLERKVLP